MATTNAKAAASGDAAAAGPKGGTDLEDLRQQYDILKIEMKAMADMMGSTAQNKAEAARDEALARMELMGNEARARVGSLQHDAENAVVRNPLMAVGIAAGIGFVLGAMTRR